MNMHKRATDPAAKAAVHARVTAEVPIQYEYAATIRDDGIGDASNAFSEYLLTCMESDNTAKRASVSRIRRSLAGKGEAWIRQHRRVFHFSIDAKQ
jgi:hypothetical protein